jgi:hypothetical protein
MKGDDARSPSSKQFGDASHDLANGAMPIQADLGDASVGHGKLGHHIGAEHELAQAEDADAELGDGHHPHAELANGDNASRGHWHAIRTIFEGNMEKGQAP